MSKKYKPDFIAVFREAGTFSDNSNTFTMTKGWLDISEFLENGVVVEKIGDPKKYFAGYTSIIRWTEKPYKRHGKSKKRGGVWIRRR